MVKWKKSRKEEKEEERKNKINRFVYVCVCVCEPKQGRSDLLFPKIAKAFSIDESGRRQLCTMEQWHAPIEWHCAYFEYDQEIFFRHSVVGEGIEGRLQSL